MIRPTFLGFESAKQALNVSQIGLDTVGHNISNASTTGYTRQRVDQVSISSSGYRTMYQTFGSQFPGQGSGIQGISQIRDPYLDNRYRAETTNNGELAVKDYGLTDINNIFDEIMTDGLHAKLGDLINAFTILEPNADSRELAMTVRNTANQLVSILNDNANALEKARNEQIEDLTVTVSDKVNDILEKISNLNVRIKEDNFYGNPSLELNDERNLLIDQLSEHLDIKVVRAPVKISEDLTIERLSIELKNSGDPPIQLVDSGSFNKLAVEVDSTTGKAGIHLLDGLSGFEIDIDNDLSNGTDGDFTNKIFKGAIKGYLDIINGEGPTAANGESTFRGIPYYQKCLDEFAQKLAGVFNKVNSISPDDVVKNKNTIVTEQNKPLFGVLDGGSGPITAKNISITQAWFNDPMYLTTSKLDPVSANPTLMLSNKPNWLEAAEAGDFKVTNGAYDFTISGSTISVDLTDPATGILKTYSGTYTQNGRIELVNGSEVGLIINTADVTTPTAGTVSVGINNSSGAANDNVLKFQEAISGKNGYATSGFFGNFQEFLINFQLEMSLDKGLNTSQLNTSTTVIGSLADRRDAISAVSVDEEATNMMTYQNYYNAAARFMTVLDEALDKIINGMGVVGR